MLNCPHCTKTFETAQKLSVHRHSSHVRERIEIAHGTVRGYQLHRRRDEQPCADCKQAWRDYYEKRKSSSSHE